MRFFAILLAVFAFLGAVPAAHARDDIMPPPKPAPRLPVEMLALGGSSQEPLTAMRLAREAKEAAKARAAANVAIAESQPVTALGREVKGSGARASNSAKLEPPRKDLRELEGHGEALDGERITVNGKEVRLFGIVTPALTSSFGPQTRLNLDRMLGSSNVLCKVTDHDGDGKPVAFCGTVKVPDLSYEMLRQGWAMVDRRTLKGNALSEVYEKAEQEAQNQNRGIFAPAPVALAVPVSDPTKAVTVPMPAPPQAAPTVIEAIVPAPAPLADMSAPEASAASAEPEKEEPAPVKAAGATVPHAAQNAAPGEGAATGDFVARYQILLGAFGMIIAAGIFGFFIMWRESKRQTQRRQALAAALRGELMSARLICRTRARELLHIKKVDFEAKQSAHLWPRVRSLVYQAHVSQLGLLGAELARQVASVYGQCADYAAYYQSSAVRTPIPQAVGETLANLAEHIDTLLLGLQEVEMTGRPLLGEDIMAEEEARAAAENVRLAVAAAHKRVLPPPTITAEAVKANRVKKAVASLEDIQPAAALKETEAATDEASEAQEGRSPKVA